MKRSDEPGSENGGARLSPPLHAVSGVLKLPPASRGCVMAGRSTWHQLAGRWWPERGRRGWFPFPAREREKGGGCGFLFWFSSFGKFSKIGVFIKNFLKLQTDPRILQIGPYIGAFSVFHVFEGLLVQISKSAKHESCSSRKNESDSPRISSIGVRLHFL